MAPAQNQQEATGPVKRTARRRPKGNPRKRQNIGLLVGSLVGLLAMVVLLWPGQDRFHARGPMNTGHEDLSCQTCHAPAPGSMRQQLQANTRAALGIREAGVGFGHLPVDNAACIDCHERDNDRHPVHRFLEPRFKEARAEIQPQTCTSCHNEHEGKRVTLPETTFCASCHQDTEVKNDPISIPHETLIANDEWASCLTCHDYHGNHVMETETDVDAALTSEEVRAYFEGDSPSPYSDERYFQARQETTDE